MYCLKYSEYSIAKHCLVQMEALWWKNKLLKGKYKWYV